MSKSELETRLAYIEEIAGESNDLYAAVLAINELTRQVARLVNIKVFELGIEDNPEDRQAEPVGICTVCGREHAPPACQPANATPDPDDDRPPWRE